MSTHYSRLGEWEFPARKTSGPANELRERMTETLKEMHDLLEEYSPAWYTEQLHKKTELLLRMLKK